MKTAALLLGALAAAHALPRAHHTIEDAGRAHASRKLERDGAMRKHERASSKHERQLVAHELIESLNNIKVMDHTKTELERKMGSIAAYEPSPVCNECTEGQSNAGGKCWRDPDQRETFFKFGQRKTSTKKLKRLSKRNEACMCPVDYEAIANTNYAPLMTRAPTVAEAARLRDARICVQTAREEEESRGVEDGEGAADECVSYKTIKISRSCVKYVESMDTLALEQFQATLVSSGFEETMLQRILFADPKEEPCWRAEKYYTGNGIAGMGYAAFNCFMRNLYHLGSAGGLTYDGQPGFVPQAIMRVAAALKAELEHHQTKPAPLPAPEPEVDENGTPVAPPISQVSSGPKPVEKDTDGKPLITAATSGIWPKSSIELTYRGAPCTPLEVGDKVLVTSFLSTSLEPLTNFISSSRCVFGYANFVAAFPHSVNPQEAEVLIPAGQCFQVLRKRHTDLFGGTASQDHAASLLSTTEHAGELLLSGIQCEADISDYTLL